MLTMFWARSCDCPNAFWNSLFTLPIASALNPIPTANLVVLFSTAALTSSTPPKALNIAPAAFAPSSSEPPIPWAIPDTVPILDDIPANCPLSIPVSCLNAIVDFCILSMVSKLIPSKATNPTMAVLQENIDLNTAPPDFFIAFANPAAWDLPSLIPSLKSTTNCFDALPNLFLIPSAPFLASEPNIPPRTGIWLRCPVILSRAPPIDSSYCFAALFTASVFWASFSSVRNVAKVVSNISTLASPIALFLPKWDEAILSFSASILWISCVIDAESLSPLTDDFNSLLNSFIFWPNFVL